jgi:hypothetical protein
MALTYQDSWHTKTVENFQKHFGWIHDLLIQRL